MGTFRALWLSSKMEVDIRPCGLFCTKFNAEPLLFQYFFDVMRIFGSVEPQTNLIFHLSTL